MVYKFTRPFVPYSAALPCHPSFSLGSIS